MLEDDFRTSGWVWIDRYETWYVFDTYEAARHHQDAQKNADDQNVKAAWLISSVIAAFGLLPLLYGAPYVISSVVTFLVLVFAAPIWMTYRRSSRWRDRGATAVKKYDPSSEADIARLTEWNEQQRSTFHERMRESQLAHAAGELRITVSVSPMFPNMWIVALNHIHQKYRDLDVYALFEEGGEEQHEHLDETVKTPIDHRVCSDDVYFHFEGDVEPGYPKCRVEFNVGASNSRWMRGTSGAPQRLPDTPV